MKTICPYCNYLATNHETLNNQKNHKEGDISFCIHCGEVSLFKNNKLIKIVVKDLNDSTKEEINDIRVAWLKIKAKQSLQSTKEMGK